MTGFQLDTSGKVTLTREQAEHLGLIHSLAGRVMSWDDLSPFVQGYVEAQAAEVAALLAEAFGSDWNGTVSFDMWAAETLARIIEDCERASTPSLCHASDGRRFWERRQAGTAGTDFPPQTVALNDDGKVRFSATGEQA